MTLTTSPAIVAAAAITASASAGVTSYRIDAEYADVSFPGSGRTIDVTVVVETDGLTGTGTERALAGYAAIALYIDGVGQTFGVAALSDPPSFDTPGNVFVTFRDGRPDETAFFGTTGAPGTVPYSVFYTPGTNALSGVAAFAGNSVAYGPSVIFTRNYDLVAYDITFIPSPPVAATALPLLITARRRRR